MTQAEAARKREISRLAGRIWDLTECGVTGPLRAKQGKRQELFEVLRRWSALTGQLYYHRSGYRLGATLTGLVIEPEPTEGGAR